jgi:hypothetical protein
MKVTSSARRQRNSFFRSTLSGIALLARVVSSARAASTRRAGPTMRPIGRKFGSGRRGYQRRAETADGMWPAANKSRGIIVDYLFRSIPNHMSTGLTLCITPSVVIPRVQRKTNIANEIITLRRWARASLDKLRENSATGVKMIVRTKPTSCCHMA